MALASLPRYVAAPSLEAPRFTLESVVQWQESSDPHTFLGIQYQPDTCGPAALTSALFCGDEPDSTPYGVPKSVTEGIALVVGSPFAVVGSFQCSPIGLDREEAFRRALEHVRTGGSRAMEQAIQTGAAGNEPNFISAAVDVTPNSTATSIDDAIGTLEQYARENYGGQAVLHMSPYLATLAYSQRLLWIDGDVLRTVLGTPVAVGAGYDDELGPNSEVGPAAGDRWIYATGAIYGWRNTPKNFPDSLGGALNRSNNDLTVLAEQPVVLAWECFTAAAAVAIGTGTGEEVQVTNFPTGFNVNNFPASTEISNDAGNPIPVSGTVTANPPTAVTRTLTPTRVTTATTTNILTGSRRVSITVIAAASTASPTLNGVALPVGTTVVRVADGHNLLPAMSIVTVSGDDVLIDEMR